MICKTALLSCLTTAILTLSMVDAACAAPPAVVAVNREVGLSVTGNFQDLTRNIGRHYSLNSTVFPEDNYQSQRSDRVHQTGWTPGFRADAQYMFDTRIMKHLYVATAFTLDDGQIEYNNNVNWHVQPASRAAYNDHARYKFGENRSGINVTGEIGKGFLVLHDRLLIMPTIQGGYRAGGRDTFTAYGQGYVGLALHIDYAITNRLVIRGRAGWAQFLDTHTYFSGNNPYAHDSRPEWSGDIGLDYRMTGRIHVTGGVRYTYLNYGRARQSLSNSFWDETVSNNGINWRNGVQLRLGVAYQL
ncbi:hypothetical protein [Acetobacter sp.]|uniref:hypothetical protein n=1 Tax=Acetobacter sp. TaxID=440 RepID=UPI0025B99AE6|nr:hypothetical protein [Acetobacter sp.]MCH4089864.1 hypothetical protein [Acetobacter sp.]MCI1298560.1 hypothetical protein [Acetobacter sp.]MCI1315125.1 hypothetical protein [Acetobacter sp.]